MIIEKRLEKILKAVNEKGSLTYREAENLVDFSKDTVRRDFIKLAALNLVTRTRGGVLAKDSSIYDYDRGFTDAEIVYKPHCLDDEDSIKNLDKKAALACKAVSLIHDNETILLDSGTTILQIAKKLYSFKNLTVLTNCIRIANEVVCNRDINTILFGGELNLNTLSMLGPDTINMIKNYHVDTLFLGVAAFSLEKGLMSPYRIEAAVKKEMIKNAQKAVLVADSTKINKFALYSFAEISDISVVITNDDVDKESLEQMELTGTQVVLAENPT